MSRSSIRPALCGTFAVLSVVAFGPASTPASAASSRTRVQLRSTALGKVLANSHGFTLYVFTRDGINRDTCVKVRNCTRTWPELKTNRKPVAGRGLKASLLATITLGHGVKQVTYAGHPLYGYVGDSSPGQTGYVGTPEFGGTWYAINAAGKLVK
ncbi:MAG: COG4315 family predicted lipoprotein [Solirubrobacteraceae bacterium]